MRRSAAKGGRGKGSAAAGMEKKGKRALWECRLVERVGSSAPRTP